MKIEKRRKSYVGYGATWWAVTFNNVDKMINFPLVNSSREGTFKKKLRVIITEI
jgi:hypothetical protein